MKERALARVPRFCSIPRRRSFVLKISNISRGTEFRISVISDRYTAAFSFISVSWKKAKQDIAIDKKHTFIVEMQKFLHFIMSKNLKSRINSFCYIQYNTVNDFNTKRNKKQGIK